MTKMEIVQNLVTNVERLLRINLPVAALNAAAQISSVAGELNQMAGQLVQEEREQTEKAAENE